MAKKPKTAEAEREGPSLADLFLGRDKDDSDYETYRMMDDVEFLEKLVKEREKKLATLKKKGSMISPKQARAARTLKLECAILKHAISTIYDNTCF